VALVACVTVVRGPAGSGAGGPAAERRPGSGGSEGEAPAGDRDQDSLPDAKDQCPDDAEDRDGFEDSDGCPDMDNDQDGVPDATDLCPTDPEDRDGFEDVDGCPDPDNDQDRILDPDDRCPNEAETYNGIEDSDGCPDGGDWSGIPAAPPGCDASPELVSGASPLAPSKVAPGSVMDPRFGGSRGFFPVKGQPPAPGSGSSPSLALELTGPRTTGPGKALGLRLAFRNRSDAPLVVLRPLDGSLERWRHPTYDLYLTDQGSGRTYRWAYSGSRCGNVNAIGSDDYVTIAPGASRSDIVNGWADHLANATVVAPGRYTVWVVYTFCSYQGRGLPLSRDHRRSDVHLGVYGSNPLPLIVR